MGKINMKTKYKIVNFDKNNGSVLVKYFTDGNLEGYLYNVDVPVQDGKYADEIYLNQIIEQLAPNAQLQRANNIKTIETPSYLLDLITPLPIHNETKEEMAIRIRADRNLKLKESDWTQSNDSPLSTLAVDAWKVYRKALRDLPAQEGFPYTLAFPVCPADDSI